MSHEEYAVESGGPSLTWPMTRVALQAERNAGMLLLLLAASHTSCYSLIAITL